MQGSRIHSWHLKSCPKSVHRNNGVKEEGEEMDEQSFVDNIGIMAGVQGDTNGIQNGNDGGKVTACFIQIRTSGNEDWEEKPEAIAENGESGTSCSGEVEPGGIERKNESQKNIVEGRRVMKMRINLIQPENLKGK